MRYEGSSGSIVSTLLYFLLFSIDGMTRCVLPEPYIGRVWPVGVATKAPERRKVNEMEESAEGAREKEGSREETTAVFTQRCRRRALLRLRVVCYGPTSFSPE
uniref:Putative secreted protein n=1 Tax=Ixodes ricinus TaxID=34613 RepID=A0A6B0UFI0_IXORI